jgi:glycine/D-amino acid oxidase-like deaminating enzyme
LAGTILHFHLFQKGLKVLCVDNNWEKNSSLVAAGMYNPIVFKRITKSWKADELVPYLNNFYPELEKHLNTSFDTKIDILRIFKNWEQQNDFIAKTEDDNYSEFINSEECKTLDKNKVENNFGYGTVTQSGWINTKLMLSKYRQFLEKEALILNEKFDFDSLKVETEKITYKEVTANKIIFCEGTQIQQNPYFNYLPMVPTQGEILTIKIENLSMDKILNKGFFIMPLGNDLYRVGATYNWKISHYETTEEAKAELIEKIKTVLPQEFEIVNHQAGIRPTVKDRKPLIGVHPEYKNLGVFNGMGTKGILIAPYFANHFSEFLEGSFELEKEVNIDRFKP